MLAQPALRTVPREVVRPEPVLDTVLQTVVEEATATAYERGVADGRAAGRREAAAARDAIAAAVFEQVERALAQARAFRAEQADEIIAVASAIAVFVLGREPHDGGVALLEHLRSAVAALDDTPLVVHASPEDVDVLAQGLVEVQGLSVVEDAALAPGEARVAGRWGSADLTRRAALDRVRELLDGEASDA